MPGNVSIITPPISTGLTTLDHAKLSLGLTDTVEDAYIKFLINRASGVIASWCGRPLGLQKIAETFRESYRSYNSNGSRPLLTTFVPIAEITSIVEDDITLIPFTDYEFEVNTGMLWRLSTGSRTGWTGSTTIVSYKAGYVLPQDIGIRTLPYDIEDACISLLSSDYYAKGQDPNITAETTDGVGSTTYGKSTTSSGLDSGLRSSLGAYRAVGW